MLNVSLQIQIIFTPDFRYDHQRYLKSGVIYRAELHRLPDNVLDSLISEGFGVTWNDDSPFSTVSDDHATEWVNGQSKSSSGLQSITQVDSATLTLVFIVLFLIYCVI